MAVAHCASVFIDDEGREIGGGGVGKWREAMSGADAFVEACRSDWQFPAVLARTEMARRAGGFDPTWNDFADLCLFLRLCLAGDVGFIAEPLLRYRVHQNGLSAGHFRDGAFARSWIHCARRAFAWPECAAAGIDQRRDEALAHVAVSSLRTMHLMRKQGSVRKFVRCYAETVAAAPRVMLRPETWARLAFGLMPRKVIFGVQDWKRRRWKRPGLSVRSVACPRNTAAEANARAEARAVAKGRKVAWAEGAV
jgi:hypothetical protein